MESKLEKLYSIIKNSKEFNLKLGEDVLQQVEAAEENIIKTEILPALSKDIAPRLEPIERELVLVVEYHPGEPISVSISRKTNITELIDAKPLEIDPEVEHKEFGHRSKKVEGRAAPTKLRVIKPNGTVIEEKNASDTFVEAVKQAGLLKVRDLGLKHCRINIVSTTKDKKYGGSQQEVEPGLYVITHSNTEDKKKNLEKISIALGLGWKIEIV